MTRPFTPPDWLLAQAILSTVERERSLYAASIITLHLPSDAITLDRDQYREVSA